MKKKLLTLLLLLPIAFSLLLLWGYAENHTLHLNRVTISDSRLPDAFSGFRIAHLTDLHNAEFQEENTQLLALLEAIRPDIIACTGDMVDSVDPHPERTLSFLEKASKIAPCFYVTGNHEPRLADAETYLSRLEAAGIQVLQGESAVIEQGGQSISILGVDDYSMFPGTSGRECILSMMSQLEALPGEGYDILLFHRPEVVPEMWELDIELILSGHTHGGQIRLPFLGGLFAPDQNLFPVFDAGVFDLGFGTMVLSSGLGNSTFPFRLNSPPEVLLITLEKA